MATYYERYINGEYEQVWNELIALGDKVREEPVYSDARAVATETMQRAKRNIEKIYARLQNLGYEFLIEKPASSVNPLQGLSQQLKDDPLLGNVFSSMVSGLESLQSLLSSMGSSAQPPKTYRGYMPPEPDIEQQIQAFEREIGKLPLSVRAWCEIVGSVDFLGDYPGLASYTRESSLGDLRGMMRQIIISNPQAIPDDDIDEDTFNEYLDGINSPFPLKDMGRLMREEMQAAKDTPPPQEPAETWWATDPLAFEFRLDVDEALEEIEAQQEEADDMELAAGTFGLIVAPDVYHKANYSGSTYDVILPDAKADTLVYGTDMYFVAYLRKSFEWAGFPGLEDYPERDEQLLETLKAGLEPI